jgi:hypothetical protein
MSKEFFEFLGTLHRLSSRFTKMRTVPDWMIQSSWWVSGIFATGAAWYFLSSKEYIFTLGSVILAFLFAILAITLHRKKDALALEQVPVELKDNLLDNYVRRSRKQPSQIRLVDALPELKAVVHKCSKQGWSSPNNMDMSEANYDMIEFLHFTWLKLAEFYPRKHFGGKVAQKYVEQYTQERYAFHRSKREPKGLGTGGRIVGVLSGSDVIKDLEQLIEPTFRRCGIKMRYFILTLSYEYIDSRNPSPES